MQPFSLPRSQYIRHKDRAPSPPASDDDVEIVPGSGGVVDEGFPATNKRDSTEVIDDERGIDVEGVEAGLEAELMGEAMKTMAELAAEHAERERQLGQWSNRGSGSARQAARSLRARRKTVGGESDSEPNMDGDEDFLEPPFVDGPSDPSPPRRHRATVSKIPPRESVRSSAKLAPKSRKKRPRSPEVDEGSGVEHGGSSRSRATSTGRRPRRATTARTEKLGPRTTRTVTDSSPTSAAVPASDRVLRSRKVRV